MRYRPYWDSSYGTPPDWNLSQIEFFLAWTSSKQDSSFEGIPSMELLSTGIYPKRIFSWIGLPNKIPLTEFVFKVPPKQIFSAVRISTKQNFPQKIPPSS